MPENQVKIKKEKSESDDVLLSSNGEHYPYGTSLRLDDELIDELGIDGLAVGDVVEVRGFAFIDAKSERTDTEESEKNMNIQMTSIKLNRVQDDRVKQLYGSET